MFCIARRSWESHEEDAFLGVAAHCATPNGAAIKRGVRAANGDILVRCCHRILDWADFRADY